MIQSNKKTHYFPIERERKENLLRTDWESTDLGGGRGCIEGAMLSWPVSAWTLIVAIERERKEWLIFD
jgi:hypothetical protein